MYKFKFVLLSLFFVGYSGAAVASCDNPSSQHEINDCASQAAKEADTKLNAAYKAVMAASDKQRQILLRKSQRAWVVFRDANCEVYYDMTRVKDSPVIGSMAPQLSLACEKKITEERTLELNRIEPMD
jgi:uncharacterized protein YecT (DUF1311 family)